MSKDKKEDGMLREMSSLTRNHILGFPLGNKYLLPEDWLEITERLVENSKPILRETICKTTINELIFNRWLMKADHGLDLKVETEGWEKILGQRLVYIEVMFGIISTAEISPVESDVFSQAQLVVSEFGEMHLFFVRLAKADKPNSRENRATVRELHIISQNKETIRFRKSFASLAANNPDFCLNTVRYGLDPVYLKIVHEKEKEHDQLMEFKRMWERTAR